MLPFIVQLRCADLKRGTSRARRHDARRSQFLLFLSVIPFVVSGDAAQTCFLLLVTG